MTRVETLAIVYNHPLVLLGMKKLRFGKGKWNGFGGGVEDGESLEGCVIRETRDEAGITIVTPERMGRILFKFETPEQNHLVHFFRATNFFGTPRESDEMKPLWFNVGEIPYEQMWKDDFYWMPLLLRGQKFEGNFHFDVQHNIVKYELNKVNNLR